MSVSRLVGLALGVVMLVAEPAASAADALRGELSLEGDWEIAFDHEDRGRKERWHEDGIFSDLPGRRTITVPSAWELIEQDYEGPAYYRREFAVPADWKGRRVRLRFEAVNYLAEVWVNGEPIGHHEGGFTPFEMRVEHVLKPGATNVVMVRVGGPIMLSQKRVDGIGPLETPQWRGGLTAGIWQPVTLLATGEIHVAEVFLKPSWADGTVTLEANLHNAAMETMESEVSIEVAPARDASTTVAGLQRRLTLRPGTTRHSWTLTIPEAKSWSPASPWLYRANLRVAVDGAESDRWSHRLGLREFTVKDKRFILNGEPIHLKAAFFEGLYPKWVATPDSVAMARREIQMALDAGFNMIRPWRRPQVPWWLDLADEMGVLVVGVPALECMGLPLATPLLPARARNEIEQTVRRDRNRTSIVKWELFNELKQPTLIQMLAPMSVLTRDLDPTRLIVDESGGFAFGANLFLPGSYTAIKFNDIHTYPGPFVTRPIFDGFLSIGMTAEEKAGAGLRSPTPGRNLVPGLMSFVSELGYGSLPDLPTANERFRREGNPLTPVYRYHERLARDQWRVLEESGLHRLYPNLGAFCLEQQAIHGAANRRMIEAVRANSLVAGYCVHALVGGDWVTGAGILDIWRNPKTRAFDETKAANQPRIVVGRVLPRNIYADQGAKITVTGINDAGELAARIAIEVVSAEGTIVFARDLEAPWQAGVSLFLDEGLETRELAGGYRLKVRATTGGGVLVAETTCDFDVFPRRALAPPAVTVAVVDPSLPPAAFLRTRGVEVSQYGPGTPVSIPVLVGSLNPADESHRALLAGIPRFVESGGTALYLGGLGVPAGRGRESRVPSDLVPFTPAVMRAKGLWTCIPHVVRPHPIFDGLPAGGAMRELYENVFATETLIGLGGDAIVGSIGFAWFSEDHKLQYLGPGDSWWGADLAVVPLGKGRAVVSQLRLLENLGRDPVADKVLFNLLRFVSR